MTQHCTKHGNPAYHNTDKAKTKAAREPMDTIMRELPINHSGGRQNTCHYCAYELGIQHGRLQFRQEMQDFLTAKV